MNGCCFTCSAHLLWQFGFKNIQGTNIEEEGWFCGYFRGKNTTNIYQLYGPLDMISFNDSNEHTRIGLILNSYTYIYVCIYVENF